MKRVSEAIAAAIGVTAPLLLMLLIMCGIAWSIKTLIGLVAA